MWLKQPVFLFRWRVTGAFALLYHKQVCYNWHCGFGHSDCCLSSLTAASLLPHLRTPHRTFRWVLKLRIDVCVWVWVWVCVYTKEMGLYHCVCVSVSVSVCGCCVCVCVCMCGAVRQLLRWLWCGVEPYAIGPAGQCCDIVAHGAWRILRFLLSNKVRGFTSQNFVHGFLFVLCCFLFLFPLCISLSLFVCVCMCECMRVCV